MVMPMHHFMIKDIVLRVSMAYNDKDFRDTVSDFVAGKSS